MNLAMRQTVPDRAEEASADEATRDAYVDTIRLIERAHRRFLEAVKDELDRLGRSEVNNVQAVLLYNVGTEELTPSELKSRGHYLGSNVSYNLKKLAELGYVTQRRSEEDRRTVRIALTEGGAQIAEIVGALIDRHMQSLTPIGNVDADGLGEALQTLRRLDRFWRDQVLYRL